MGGTTIKRPFDGAGRRNVTVDERRVLAEMTGCSTGHALILSVDDGWYIYENGVDVPRVSQFIMHSEMEEYLRQKEVIRNETLFDAVEAAS